MIPATKREALAVLTELCEMSPDVRLGQLLAHLGFLGEDQTGRSLWDIDDEQFLSVLYHHRAELAHCAGQSSSGEAQAAVLVPVCDESPAAESASSRPSAR